jgi:hypothetical protein
LVDYFNVPNYCHLCQTYDHDLMTCDKTFAPIQVIESIPNEKGVRESYIDEGVDEKLLQDITMAIETIGDNDSLNFIMDLLDTKAENEHACEENLAQKTLLHVYNEANRLVDTYGKHFPPIANYFPPLRNFEMTLTEDTMPTAIACIFNDHHAWPQTYEEATALKQPYNYIRHLTTLLKVEITNDYFMHVLQRCYQEETKTMSQNPLENEEEKYQ